MKCRFMQCQFMQCRFCLTAAVMLFAGILSAQQITVSPTGAVSSLQQAVEAVRKLPKDVQPITVEFQGGDYFITEPVVLTAADSGTEKSPVIYKAAKGQNVVINGGKKITGWKKEANGVWTANIPEVAAGKWYFEQLYINGKRATRCREPNYIEPNTDYFYTEEKVDTAVDPLTGKPEPMSRRAFIASGKDIASLKNVPKELLKDVTFTLFHSWESSTHRLAGIDFDNRIVAFTGPAAWDLMHWEPRQRYQIENYKEALNQSGEWFLDRSGTLSYIPFPNEDLTQLEVIAPVADSFLKLQGNTAKDAKDGFITNLTFDGLKFLYSGYTLPPQGHSIGQSAITAPFAVQLDGCRNVAFENCEIAHIGANAVRFFRGCNDCRFVKNYVHDLGAGAVYLGQAWEADHSTTGLTERNLVENNIIRDGGHFDLGGIGVWLGHTSYNKVLHNDISEFYYTGISVGWQWGFQPSRSNHNNIEFNHIHHLGHWVLSDMGGVYTLGVSPGTTVSNNVIHDVYAYSYGGWGLYTDEGSTGIVMENNLVYRVKTGTVHQHYGDKNIFRNNILAYSLTHQIQRSRIEDHISFFLENNIILWDKEGTLFGSPWTKDSLAHWGDNKVVIKGNLYWSPDNDMEKAFPSKDGQGSDLQTWQKLTGHDTGSLVADPKFKDPKNGDFTLPDDSSAFKTGFKRFDYSKAGVFGDDKWIALAKNYEHLNWTGAPESPAPLPFKMKDNFDTPRTKPILKVNINDEKSGLIRLSENKPFSGKNCLEIADSDKLQHAYNPHLEFLPKYKTGKVSISFMLRVQKNSTAHIEWRNAERPYKIGPTILIRSGKLLIKEVEPLAFPSDEWVKFETNAELGENSKGLWNLTLIFADGTKKEFKDIPSVHNGWTTLDWFGFCNLCATAENSSFFIDDLVIENQ